MSNTPRTPTHGSPQAKPLHVALNTIGRGLIFVFPKSSLPDGQDGALKPVEVDSLATPWIAPFLDEYKLSQQQPQGYVTITQEGGILRSRLRAQFAPELECIRCLAHFRLPLEVESSAIFADEARYAQPNLKSSQQSDDDEFELQPDDMETYTYRGQGLTLDEFVLDTLQTSIPDFPLCIEDCPGLCAQCGERKTDDHSCG